MIIEKNMNVKIKVDSEIVSAYLNELDNNSDELAELAEKMSDETLSYITTYYLAKLYQSDKEKYNKYVGYIRSSVEKDSSEKKEPVLHVGDRIIITTDTEMFLLGKVDLLYEIAAVQDDAYIIVSVEWPSIVKRLSKKAVRERFGKSMRMA